MIFESWHVSIERYRAGGDVHGGAARCASKRGTSQTSTHSLEGRKREERLGELRNVARHKRALTSWRGGRGIGRLVCIETVEVSEEDASLVREVEGWGAWCVWEWGCCMTTD